MESSRPLFVYVGIGLFVLGFLLTVISSSGSLTASESSTGDALSTESDAGPRYDGLVAFVGIFIGLLGVVTATVGPLTTVVRFTKRK